MREINLILTNIVDDIFDIEEHQRIYRFDKNKSDEEYLKNMVVNINKDQHKIVYLITNEKNLFEFFNRNIICKKMDGINTQKNSVKFVGKEVKPENYFCKINLITNLSFFMWNAEVLKDMYKNNIENILNQYGNIFNINIEKLIEGTTYKANNRNDLLNLIYEDLNLIHVNGIITSRLCVVFYRLTYFDLDISKVAIGRFFANYFGKSESFKMNLNRNSAGLFFTDLNNKIFRGYKIKPLKLEIPDSTFDLKIKIAKNLLKKKVKIEIVAEVLELSIDELNDKIYGMEKNIKVSNEGWKKDLQKYAMEEPFNDVKIGW